MKYNVIIIGGGLSGLALSISLQRKGYAVAVIEKGEYPRHKVCGEYISMESYRYLQEICPTLSKHHIPKIHTFRLTAGENTVLETPLTLGGFGISRHLLEYELMQEAIKCGVVFYLKNKALTVDFQAEIGTYFVKTNTETLAANIVCGAFGRKSNMDYLYPKKYTIPTNYLGVKYHIQTQHADNLIAIHSFEGGYCGISNIEDGRTCLCYIVNAEKLKACNNDIKVMEERFLYQNAALKQIFQNSTFLFQQPLTISNVHFEIKEPINQGVFCVGDAAGCIAPITGNGMSMALRSAFYLANLLDDFFQQKIDRNTLASAYSAAWKEHFSLRIRLSRFFQKLSESPNLTKMTIRLLHFFPVLQSRLIRLTHGLPF